MSGSREKGSLAAIIGFMAWEWVGPVATATVGVVGIVGT